MLNAQRITLWAAVTLLLVIGVAPLLAMVTASVMIDGKPSLMHYQALVFSRRAWALLGHSVTLSSLTALCGTVLGVPLGILLGKTDLPLRYLFVVLFTLPLAWIVIGAFQAAETFAAEDLTVNFDEVTQGQLPTGWTIDATNPRGRVAEWSVVTDPNATSKPNVLTVKTVHGYVGNDVQFMLNAGYRLRGR